MGQKSDFYEVCLSSSAIFYLSPFPEVASEDAAAKAAPGDAPTFAVQDTPSYQQPLGAPVCVGQLHVFYPQRVPGVPYILLKKTKKLLYVAESRSFPPQSLNRKRILLDSEGFSRAWVEDLQGSLPA